MDGGRPKQEYIDKFVRLRNGEYGPVGRLCQRDPNRLLAGRSRLAIDWSQYCELPPPDFNPIENPDPSCTWAVYRKVIGYRVIIPNQSGPPSEFTDFAPFASWYRDDVTLGETLFNGFEVVAQGNQLIAPLIYDEPEGNGYTKFYWNESNPGPGPLATVVIEAQGGWLRDETSPVNVCEPLTPEWQQFDPPPFIPIPDWLRTVIPEIGKQMLPNPFNNPITRRLWDKLPFNPFRSVAAPPVTIPRPTWKPVPFPRTRPRPPAPPPRDPRPPTPPKPAPQRQPPARPPRRSPPRPPVPQPPRDPSKPPLPGQPRQPRRPTPGPRTPETPRPIPRRPPRPDTPRTPDTPTVPRFPNPRPVPSPRPRPVPSPRPTPKPVPRPLPKPRPIPQPPQKPPLPYGPPEPTKPQQPIPRPNPGPPTPKPPVPQPLPPSPNRPPNPLPKPYPYPQPRPVPVPVPQPSPRPVPTPTPFPNPWPSPAPVPSPNPGPIPTPRPRPQPIPQPVPRPVPVPFPFPVPLPDIPPLPDMRCPPCPELIRERLIPMPIPGPPGPPGQDGKDGKDGGEPVLLVIQKGILPAIQQIEFSDGNVGEYSVALPARLAFVNVEIIGDTLPKDRFAVAVDGLEEIKAGTVALVRNGRPISSYTLARFTRSHIQIPFDLEGEYRLYIRPGFPCTVQVSHEGDTYQVRRLAGSANIPTIASSQLFD